MNALSPVTMHDEIGLSRNVRAKLAHTIADAALTSGLSRSMLYLAIGRGDLRARKCGARTLILDTDLRRFLRDLPRFAGSKAPTAAKASDLGRS
jgi:hypothetical protein